jgi:hypothetical protein
MAKVPISPSAIWTSQCATGTGASTATISRDRFDAVFSKSRSRVSEYRAETVHLRHVDIRRIE